MAGRVVARVERSHGGGAPAGQRQSDHDVVPQLRFPLRPSTRSHASGIMVCCSAFVCTVFQLTALTPGSSTTSSAV